MSALKESLLEIELDKKRHLMFDLNIIDDLNDRYGGYDKLDQVLNDKNPTYIKELKWLLTRLINEGARYKNMQAKETVEEEITEEYLGMLINPGNMESMTKSIFKAFNLGTVGTATIADENSDDEEDLDPTQAAANSTT